MPYKNKEKDKQYHQEYAKRWRQKHVEQYKNRMRLWQEKNRDKCHQYSQKYYWANREKEIERCMAGNAKRHRKLRNAALVYYGGNPPHCACCGEFCILFLTIDHIAGGGGKHRKEIRRYGTIYEWLKREKYPLGFRVLCMNCNWVRGKYGYCPHEKQEPARRGNVENALEGHT